tara:strand:- start:1104 stop:1556 length:453 start_codon:yes stop_codon:yes gene_type:complete
MIHDLNTLSQARQTSSSLVAGLPSGTKVMTLRGEIAVEGLRKGDRIIARCGARALRSVRRESHDRCDMVRITASSLGLAQPETDIIVSPQQKFLVDGVSAKGPIKTTVTAEDMVDGLFICTEELRKAELFVLEFDGPAVIYAGTAELATS